MCCDLQHIPLILWIFLVYNSAYGGANNQLSIRNVEACISFDKSGNSQLNVGWDSIENANRISVFYKATGSSETKLSYELSRKVIFGIIVNGNPIGSNLTVQVAPILGRSLKEGTRSNPVTTVVNYIYSVTWKRISPNHVEFNCTLACRTSIQACEVHLNNKTSNVSTNLVKLEFSTWATVNFYCLDPQQNYVYEVFARTINVNGLTVHGVLPPLEILPTTPTPTDGLCGTVLTSTMQGSSKSAPVMPTSATVTSSSTMVMSTRAIVVSSSTIVMSRSTTGMSTSMLRTQSMVTQTTKKCPSDSLSTGATVALSCSLTFLLSVTTTAIITFIITYVFMKNAFEGKRRGTSMQEPSIQSCTNPTVIYDTVQSPSHNTEDIKLQQNPAYGTSDKVIMDDNPAYESYQH